MTITLPWVLVPAFKNGEVVEIDLVVIKDNARHNLGRRTRAQITSFIPGEEVTLQILLPGEEPKTW